MPTGGVKKGGMKNSKVSSDNFPMMMTPMGPMMQMSPMMMKMMMGQMGGGGGKGKGKSNKKKATPGGKKTVIKQIIGKSKKRREQRKTQAQKTGVVKKTKEKTPEEQEALRQKNIDKHEETVAKEGRTMVGDSHIQGEIVQKGWNHMWVKPSNPNAIPASVKPKLKKMNDEVRAKCKGTKKFCGGIADQVVYVHLADVSDTFLPIEPGAKCKFKLYTDNKGVGGCNVESA